ncbi:uncharacterized protein JCM6883_004197 [Sporobolomyces salmoneus]|uniref:uncharacterized protein n=1 Tax=Sporobolomyces salmoneus TaxID=183962 RepID=UPI00317C215E
MLPFLPYDVLPSIIDQVEDNGDLAQCCLTSKALLTAARPRLYAIIHILTISYSSSFAAYLGHDFEDYGTNAETHLLLSTLRQHHHLCSLVRYINWKDELVMVEFDCEKPKAAFPCAPTKLLEDLLQFLTSAKHFRLTGIPGAFQTEMDEVVAAYQHSDGPQKHASFSLGGRLTVLRGMYAGFEESVSFRDFNSTRSLPSALEQSQESLRYLSTVLDDGLDLASFVHIEHLSLKLPSIPSTATTNLLRVLPQLPSLRALILVDWFGGRACVEALTNSVLPLTLLSRPTGLSVEYDCKNSLASFVPFLHALPAASSLKRINFVGI